VRAGGLHGACALIGTPRLSNDGHHMARTYDVIVIGVGGMGSATLFECARRGLRALGLEQFDIPHELGSSHGLTRIIRLAYFESPAYVPLLVRAYERWRALEDQGGERVFYRTGSIDAGWEGGRTVRGSLEACAAYSLPHDVLTAQQLNARYPGYSLPAGMVAVLQPDGGILEPERCVRLYTELARQHGAEVHTREPVVDWRAGPDGVEVETASSSYRAKRLVMTAGAWTRALVAQLRAATVPERQVVLWTEVQEPDLFTPARFPVFNLQSSYDDSERYYGFPSHGRPGFKIGLYHHRHESGNPEDLRREPDDEDEELLRRGIRAYFPKANGPTIARQACLFTNTPDGHFILDLHPDAPAVAIAAGFSGHGFKFCSVIGEIMADLATRGRSDYDLTPFRIERLA
jgi:sarcosine oxidase